jgi:YbbR domain-containing protein
MIQWWSTNTGLKVVALLLATVTWFFVKNITSERRMIEAIPVEVKTKPELTVLAVSDHTVNVILRGTRTDLWQVSRPELTAVLDLRHEEQTGDVTVALEPRLIRHPPRVQVVQVLPPYITVRVGTPASRTNGEHKP